MLSTSLVVDRLFGGCCSSGRLVHPGITDEMVAYTVASVREPVAARAHRALRRPPGTREPDTTAENRHNTISN
jgi:hypothetical protein